MNRFTGCLEADDIARYVTQGLIDQFDCAFARIWLVEPERTHLRLVASSGLYTRLDGSFAQVPMGAFKVGKIAQHCIPFLSNSLPDEIWVKDRTWAIENNIKGFAGLPLMAQQQAIGVLAIFSHTAMAPEFLEVLQMLSLSVSGALASALKHSAYKVQQAKAQQLTGNRVGLGEEAGQRRILSEQLSTKLGHQKLSLLGVERPLSSAVYQLLIQVAEYLNERPCHYCRLVYDADIVVLEAMLSATVGDSDTMFATLQAKTQQLGGAVQYQEDDKNTVVEVRWQLPQSSPKDSSCENADSALPPPPSLPLSPSPLSEREQQVLELLARGLRDREISEKLFISERTVKFHTKNTLAKMGVKTRTHAVFIAAKQGWL